MEPTFPAGTTVYYSPGNHPVDGDVIIFSYPQLALQGSCGGNPAPASMCAVGGGPLSHTLGMKRVVGVGGDTLAMTDGHLIRNGQLVSEPYNTTLCDTGGCEYKNPVTVPAGQYYVMSDDRHFYPEDSRTWGPITAAAIAGTVVSR
jgi:signal peptidase I